MIVSGPVNRYDEHIRMDLPPKTPPIQPIWLSVLNNITTGFLYKFVVAEYLRDYWFGPGMPLRSEGWLDTAILFIYIFFDFAGYSRIALGLGQALGVPTPENFKAPFRAASLADFFTRWHMSLGTFVQRNLYTPLQLHFVRRWGVKRAAYGSAIALGFAWIFVGLWHRISLMFLVYGLGMAALVWSEKYVRDRALKRAWARKKITIVIARILGPIYVFVVMTTMIHLVVGEIFR